MAASCKKMFWRIAGASLITVFVIGIYLSSSRPNSVCLPGGFTADPACHIMLAPIAVIATLLS